MRIQTEVAQLAGDDAQTREMALAHLTQGIDRATQLIEQLLTLSRLDNLKELNHQEPIHWSEIITSLIGELYFSCTTTPNRITALIIREILPLSKGSHYYLPKC